MPSALGISTVGTRDGYDLHIVPVTAIQVRPQLFAATAAMRPDIVPISGFTRASRWASHVCYSPESFTVAEASAKEKSSESSYAKSHAL